MITVRHLGRGAWTVDATHFSPKLKQVAKSTPGMRWDSTRNQWIGYIDACETVVSRLRKECGLRVDDGDLYPMNSDDYRHNLPVKYEGMREYQKVGCDFLVATGRTGALLADDMGLGKSLQALRAARTFKQPTLIVCPAFIQSVWISEVEKWWPEAAPARVLTGIAGGPVKMRVKMRDCDEWRWAAATADRADAGVTEARATVFAARADTAPAWSYLRDTGVRLDPNFEVVPQPLEPALVTICHYGILYAWVDHLVSSIRTVIFDEAHYLTGAAKSEWKPKGSRRSAASKVIAEAAVNRFALTGTPLTNRPRDLHNLVDTISPGRFGKFFDFGLRYADGKQEEVAKDRTAWKFDGASHLDELNSRLKWLMLRRTKADVALELPPKTRQTVVVDVAKKHAMKPAGMLSNDKLIRSALAAAADGKMKDVVEVVMNHRSAGKKVIVFTYRRAVAEMLVSALIQSGVSRCRFIHGGVTQKKRDEAIAAGHDGRVDVLVATIDVTAGGISLAFADVGVFAELTYEPHELIQAEARLHRYDERHQRRDSVLIQYVLARGSVDELIADAVVKKLDVFEKAIGTTGEGLQKALRTEAKKTTDEQLRSLYERMKGAA